MGDISNETGIETLLHQIISHLSLDNNPEFEKNLLSKWVRNFHENLIFNVGLLRRLNPSRLQKLEVPLILMGELEKIVETSRIRSAALDLSHLSVKEGTINSQHAKAAAKIQERDKRFTLKLTQKQKDLIRQSWNILLSSSGNVNSVNQKKEAILNFSRAFYPNFFKENPPSTRLFETSNLESQARALGNMLSWIVRNLDNMAKIEPVLAQMGGRHELYGVNSDEYKKFGKSIAITFHTLGKSEITDEMISSWEQCIVSIGELMMSAVKSVKLGFRGELFRERGNGSWVKVWATLTLSTLYLFYDESFTKLKARYDLQHVENISSLENAHEFSFELASSEEPRFVVHLAAVTVSSFNDWIFEIDWRIKAIHRVYGNSKYTNSDTGSFGGTSEEPERQITENQVEKLVLKNKKVENIPLQESTESLIDDVSIHITPNQKEMIKSSWNEILSKEFINKDGTREEGLARFYAEFYPRFFTVNPSGKRLFEESTMQKQVRALTKMMAMIVKSIDSPETIQETLYSLGGRHEIYRVQESDYLAFSNAICDTIEIVLGQDKFIAEARDAWFKVMTKLSGMMIRAGKKIRKEGVKGVIFRKIGKESDWKKSAVSVSLDTLYIYKGEKMSKLRSSFPLKEIYCIDELPISISSPTKFGFVLNLRDYRKINIYFCLDNEKQSTYWMNELNWHVQAVHRLYKEELDLADDADESSIGEGSGIHKTRGDSPIKPRGDSPIKPRGDSPTRIFIGEKKRTNSQAKPKI